MTYISAKTFWYTITKVITIVIQKNTLSEVQVMQDLGLQGMLYCITTIFFAFEFFIPVLGILLVQVIPGNDQNTTATSHGIAGSSSGRVS